MPLKTEKELNETQRALWLKALAAMELRNFGYAISLLQGNSETRAAVSNRPAIVAPRRGRETKGRQEKSLQYLDGTDRGDEGAARNKKNAAARDGNDRKSFGRRAVQPTG